MPSQQELNAVTYAERARRIASANPGIADYKELAQLMLEDVRGDEADLLARLLPGYMRSILSRRSKGGSDEELWESFLDERLSTTNRGAIFNREAAAEELDEAATRRFRFGGNLDRRGQQFQMVATKMREHGVTAAGQLPRATGVASLHRLEVTLVQKKFERMRAERRSRALMVLRRLRDNLRANLERGEGDTVVLLRSRRDGLVDQLDIATWKGREYAILHEVLREMASGKG